MLRANIRYVRTDTLPRLIYGDKENRINSSCLGRNVQFSSERYGRKVDDIMNANVSLSFVDLDSCSRINQEMHDRAKLVWEMIMVKDDLKCMTDLQFSREDVAMFRPIEW